MNPSLPTSPNITQAQLSDLLLSVLKTHTSEADYENHRVHWRDIHTPYYMPHWQEFLNTLPKESLQILDCGSGYGFWSLFLANHGHQVTAFDHSEKYLDVLNKTAHKTGFKIPTEQGDLHDLSALGSKQFDATFSFSTLHIVEKPLQALGEMLRLTRPGGYIMIGFGNTQHPINLAKWKGGKQYRLEVTPEYLATWMGEAATLCFSRDSFVEDARVRHSCGDTPLFYIRAYQRTDKPLPPASTPRQETHKKQGGLFGLFTPKK